MSHENLKKLCAAFYEKHDFHVGQIVEWKPGMKNKRSEGPFVVIECLPEPVMSERIDSGSPYFREPLDLILGRMDADGDFVLHHYDSRRMKPTE